MAGGSGAKAQGSRSILWGTGSSDANAASSRLFKSGWMDGGRYHGTGRTRNVSYFRLITIFPWSSRRPRPFGFGNHFSTLRATADLCIIQQL
jgi:hypothetical protein